MTAKIRIIKVMVFPVIMYDCESIEKEQEKVVRYL